MLSDAAKLEMLDRALVAGESAENRLVAVTTVLFEASRFTTSLDATIDDPSVNAKLDEATALLQVARADLDVFARELAVLGLTLDLPAELVLDRTRMPSLRALVGLGPSRSEANLDLAHAHVATLLGRVGVALVELRRRVAIARAAT